MPDIVDVATRSQMMSKIRGRDTKPELSLRSSLRRRGLSGYRCHYSKVPGRPDVAFVGLRVAVFVDGAFWHGHPDHFTFGKSGPFWDAKIRKNVSRDREVDVALFELGWIALRYWDFEIAANPDGVADRISVVVEGRRRAKAAVRSRS